MKNIATIAAISAALFAGSAMADGAMPITKAQFWITSMETVPAGAEMHKQNHQINMASVLQPRSKTFAREDYREVVAGFNWGGG